MPGLSWLHMDVCWKFSAYHINFTAVIDISILSYFSVMYDITIFLYFTYKIVICKSVMPGIENFGVFC